MTTIPPRRDRPNRELEVHNLNLLVRQIEEEKANNNGKLPYGFVSVTLSKNKPWLPWLPKDAIYNHMKKLNREKSSLQ